MAPNAGERDIFDMCTMWHAGRLPDVESYVASSPFTSNELHEIYTKLCTWYYGTATAAIRLPRFANYCALPTAKL